MWELTKDMTPLEVSATTILDMFTSPLIEVFRVNEKDKAKLWRWNILKRYNENSYAKLKRLNEDIESRVEFYFTPNWQMGREESDGERWLKNCGSYEWIVLDIDDGDTDKSVNLVTGFMSKVMENPELEPNLVIRTGKWYHAYYKMKEPLIYNQANRDLYKLVFKIINEQLNPEMAFEDVPGKLAKKMNVVDLAVSDCSRLFRVPGSKYWKNWEDSILNEVRVEAVHLSQTGRIDFLKLIERLKIFVMKNKQPAKKLWRARKMDVAEGQRVMQKESIDVQVNSIDVSKIVESCGYTIKNNIIYQNWEKTSWWTIFPEGNIVKDFSHERERPGGTCIQFLMMHFKSNQRIVYQHIQECFGINCSAVLEYAGGEIHVDFEEVQVAGGEVVRDEHMSVEDLWILHMKHSCNVISYTPVQWVETDTANFVIKVLWKIALDWKIKIIIQLIWKHFTSRAIVLPSDGTVAAVNKKIRWEGMFDIRTQSNKFINLLTLWLAKAVNEYDEIKLIKSIKYLNDGSFVWWNCVQRPGWEVALPDEKTKMIDWNIINFSHQSSELSIMNITEIKDNIWFDLTSGSGVKYTGEMFRDLILENLPAIYEASSVVPLLLALINWLFSDFYYSNKIKFPHLIIWGETRAGKTEIISLCKRLLSFKDDGGTGVMWMTQFPFLVAGSTWVTTHLTEWVNDAKHSKFVQVEAKNSFDFREVQRGTADQRVMEYKMIWNILFDWEEVPSEDALQTRSIVCFFKKRHKKRVKSFNKTIRNLIEGSAWLINYAIEQGREIFTNRDKYEAMASECEDELLDYLHDNNMVDTADDTDRIAQNYSQLLLIYKMMTPALMWDNEVLEIIAKAMVTAIKGNKSFNSTEKHLTNFFTPLQEMMTRAARSSRGVIRFNPINKTITITKWMVSAFIKTDLLRWSFNQSLSFLEQNDYIKETGDWSIRIELKDPIHKKNIWMWRSFLYMWFENDVFRVPGLEKSTEILVSEILTIKYDVE